MKYLFYIINSVLIAAIAYFCVDIGYKNLFAHYLGPAAPSFSRTPPAESKGGEAKTALKNNAYDTIIKRNLFKVEVEHTTSPSSKEEIEATPVEALEPTSLKLALWGTVTGVSRVYAVIEDKTTRQQALYEIGDLIQEATLKQILRHKVILTYQGKDQVLEMEFDNPTAAASQHPFKTIQPPEISLDKRLIDESIHDMGMLMKQIKIRPHFTEGEPDGLMLYGIRPNSVFMQMGLRNGDIVKEINGMPITSAMDASTLFSQIKDAQEAKLTLFRQGKITELLYQLGESTPPIPGFTEETPEQPPEIPTEINPGETHGENPEERQESEPEDNPEETPEVPPEINPEEIQKEHEKEQTDETKGDV